MTGTSLIFRRYDALTLWLTGRLPEGVALLLVRIALGGVFWRSGRTKVEEGTWFSLSDSTIELFRTEYAGVPLPLDDDRLVKEIALFADRCDVSEELTRAASHLKQFRTYLAAAEPMGRSLDFLTQELAREFNTIGSKANNAEIAHLVVTGKTEIEKIREQVQNVE